MGMIFAIIGIVLFLILLVVAFAIGMNREKTEKEELKPLIHASGIYSVVRLSPRDDIFKQRPNREELAKYLSETNVDINGKSLPDAEKREAVDVFFKNLEKNIAEIEAGDRSGAEFYYYEFDKPDSVCAKYISRGQYVTREDLHRLTRLIPPFHLGCTCNIRRHAGGDKLKDTTELGLRPLINESAPVPALPNWHTILKA
jgi:hypothetical protein